MRKIFLALGSVIISFCIVRVASAATLTLNPTSGSKTAGQIFSVDINLDTTGAAVDGVDVYSLHYNPAILEVQDANSSQAGVQITPGTLFAQTLTNTVNTSSGLIQFSQVTSGGTTYNGSGVLASISFKAIANGTSNLTFDYSLGSTSDTNVAGGSTDKLTSVGTASFTVTGGNPPVTPTPTPTPIPAPPTGYVVDASKYPSGMFIKYSGNATVYLINGGTKYPITDWTVYQNRVPSSRAIITIPGTVTFPSGPVLGLRSGTLVKSVNSPTVFLFDGSHRLAFTNQTDFLSLGYRFNQVYSINDDALFNAYPVININKPTFTRPYGTLFKYANNPTIYYLDMGSKKAFTSMFMFKAWYDRLDQVVTISDTETYPNGSNVLLPSGTVVKVQNTSQNYIMVGGVPRPILTAYMNSLGVQNSQVMTISQSDLDKHGTIGSNWQ